MIGLIYKDLLTLRKQAVFFILFIGVFAVFAVVGDNGVIFGGIITMLAATLPLTALSYDEKAKWDKYAVTMPIRRRDIVLSKYVLGFLLLLCACIINMTAGYLIGQNDWYDTLILALVLLGVGLLMMSAILPVSFKFGVERARMGIFIVPVLGAGLAYWIASSDQPTLIVNQYVDVVPYAAAILMIIICWVSLSMSTRIYERKELN